MSIAEILVAYNSVFGGDRCFRIGPISRHSRIIGNLFAGGRVGGTNGVMKSRMRGRTDTIDRFALAGNVFADCRYACFVWTDDALLSPHFYWARNVWHAAETARTEGPFILDWRPQDLEGMWAVLRPTDKFLAAGQHSRFVEACPLEKARDEEYRVHPDPAELVTDDLLKDLVAKRFLTGEDMALLAAWHPRRRNAAAESSFPMGPRCPALLGLPEDWQGPGSPLGDALAAEAEYRDRMVAGSPIRVNVGYSWEETVDRQGNTWLPDQIFERGGYGYIGDSLLRRPRQVFGDVDIQQTQNDEIYRTGRTQLTRHLITVPDGTYDVVLHFAHLVEGKLWQPTIAIKIEGRTVLQGLSANGLERLRAVSKRIDHIAVADGLLAIDLTQSDIALCGVEIFRR